MLTDHNRALTDYIFMEPEAHITPIICVIPGTMQVCVWTMESAQLNQTILFSELNQKMSDTPDSPQWSVLHFTGVLLEDCWYFC